MPEYRAYTVGPDGHFISSTPLRCLDDAEAIELAEQLAGLYTIEVWRADRLVKSIKAEPGRDAGTNRPKPD